MKIFGLTGNIGTGKSTVADILEELGAYIIDADQIARQIVEKGSDTLKELAAEFGKEIVNSDQALNRKKLSEIVFSDKNKLDRLNKITHPKILDQIRNEIFISMEKGFKITIIEAALIGVEGRLRNLLNGLIVVTTTKENQIGRIKQRDNLSIEDIEKRIESQKKNNEIIKYADHVINNDSSLDELRDNVSQVWSEINKK